jgi:lipopolysaccharide/colanic/teichoic acid biosynthesis glycosyltransferase
MGLNQNGLLKRSMDLFLTVSALLLLWPVLLGLWILVRWRLGSPAIFCQVRPGWNERPITLYKFRTMTEERGSDGNLLSDGHRLTPLGRMMRNTSLDELPELFNVLKGELSLVGPRPLYTHYLPWYSQRERLRHAVKPGLTGLAQIHGRNYLPWNQRLSLDVWYVENWSLGLDIKILLKTVIMVLGRKGVAANADDAETDLALERGGDQAEAENCLAREGDGDPDDEENDLSFVKGDEVCAGMIPGERIGLNLGRGNP